MMTPASTAIERGNTTVGDIALMIFVFVDAHELCHPYWYRLLPHCNCRT